MRKITDNMCLKYIEKAILRPDLMWETGMPCFVKGIFRSGDWSLSPSSYQRGHRTMKEAIHAAIILQKKSKKRTK